MPDRETDDVTWLLNELALALFAVIVAGILAAVIDVAQHRWFEVAFDLVISAAVCPTFLGAVQRWHIRSKR